MIIVLKTFKKFFKTFKIFKFVETLTNSFQITIINLNYNTVYLNCYKLLQTLINLIKYFRKCFNYFLKFFNIIPNFKYISNFNNFSKHNFISYLFKMFYVFTKNLKIS